MSEEKAEVTTNMLATALLDYMASQGADEVTMVKTTMQMLDQIRNVAEKEGKSMVKIYVTTSCVNAANHMISIDDPDNEIRKSGMPEMSKNALKAMEHLLRDE